jgi:twitching motility protein PilT
VGADTGSYTEALRHILRQDPDVILIGEIRDADSMMAIALTGGRHRAPGAEHHAHHDAAQTISRIISFFPPHQQQEIRYLVASTLQAVISQRLVANPAGERRYPAVEIMIATSTIREFIRDPEKTILIRQAIQEGFVQYQMQTFDQSLMQLVKEDRINVESALQASSNPHEFLLRLKGIQASSDTTWDRFEQNAIPQAAGAKPA